MSWNGSGDWRDGPPPDDGWSEMPDDGWSEVPDGRWPLTWRGLLPRERWIWFDRLWGDVCSLQERYRLAVRSQWWEDELQLEVLAALAAWVARYDAGEWDDPPGKLSLLFDLERIAGMLRDGIEPFAPDRDRAAFVRHLIDRGCEPPARMAPPDR